MPGGTRRYEADENPHRNRERGLSRDREHPISVRREGERHGGRDRNKRESRDERYKEERAPGHERKDRKADMVTPSQKDYVPDHRLDHHKTYTEASVIHSEINYYEPQQGPTLYNLKYLLTTRGLCQLLELLFNLLIVICAGVPYSNKGGYRDLASLGGLYTYYFGGANAFTGAGAKRVQELDQQFYQLKLPPYIFSMACGGALMAYVCVLLALGVLRVPFRWPVVLLVEAVMDGLISLAYFPGLAFYFIKLKDNYANPICQEREALYKSKGHEGYGCQLNGADVTCGLFGVLAAIVFALSTVLAIRAFREVRESKKQAGMEDNNL